MIVFVIAMDSEAAPLIESMTDLSVQTVHGRKIYRGCLSGKPCAAVVCGVGKVNAAAGAQYAIDVLGAEKIVNVGVAGGLNGGTEVGKIYVIGEAVQYDFDLLAINGTPIGTLNEYSVPYLKLCVPPCPYPLRKLGTGDRFNDDEDDFLLLTRELKADIRDMEGGAIAQVCLHADVPFYSFKAISDVAGAGATGEQFKRNLELCAQNLRREIFNVFRAVND